MKKLNAVIVGLAAIMLVSVLCSRVSAEEKSAGAPGSYVQYAKLDPVAAKPVVRVSPLSPVANAPEKPAYPVKLALGQPTVRSKATEGANVAQRTPTFSITETAGEHFIEVITVFGERVVPPPSESSLLHIEAPLGRSAADVYRWTFWKYKNDSERPLFGTDFLFTYQYPTQGQGLRGFRNGEVIVGLGLNIPLTSFRPIGHLFTSR